MQFKTWEKVGLELIVDAALVLALLKWARILLVASDITCCSLCCISGGCETVSNVFVWLPIPCKFNAVSGLKAVSVGYQKFRDIFCAADSNSC